MNWYEVHIAQFFHIFLMFWFWDQFKTPILLLSFNVLSHLSSKTLAHILSKICFPFCGYVVMLNNPWIQSESGLRCAPNIKWSVLNTTRSTNCKAWESTTNKSVRCQATSLIISISIFFFLQFKNTMCGRYKSNLDVRLSQAQSSCMEEWRHSHQQL